jgi:primosomal protein N' (replication factor Y)
LGTERLFETVENLFPGTRVARIDQESDPQDLDLENLDILIGTRKAGLEVPLPRLGLIGVVLADQLLFLPRFQAAERAYQILKNLALNPCPWLVIQTYHPEHHVFRGLRLGYQVFFEHEIQIRRKLNYPPFSRLAELSWKGKDLDRLRSTAEEVISCLSEKGVSLLGPKEELIKGEFVLSLLLKADHLSLHQSLKECLPLQSTQTKFVLDLDPF